MNPTMSKEDQAFVEEIDAVQKKHGKMLLPHIEAVLRIVPISSYAQAVVDGANIETPKEESVVSPLQAGDLNQGSDPASV